MSIYPDINHDDTTIDNPFVLSIGLDGGIIGFSYNSDDSISIYVDPAGIGFRIGATWNFDQDFKPDAYFIGYDFGVIEATISTEGSVGINFDYGINIGVSKDIFDLNMFGINYNTPPSSYDNGFGGSPERPSERPGARDLHPDYRRNPPADNDGYRGEDYHAGEQEAADNWRRRQERDETIRMFH